MIHRSPGKTRPAMPPEAVGAGVGEEFEAGVAARPMPSMRLMPPVPPVSEAGVAAGTGAGGRG
ncbi:hypothetical protein [Streptosporangium sp. V21-05]|uniref:hypothetical protein n=1 Tax=Streptosporangium sp. V21-05 TaxID=3446115 RepID=UPI003F539DDA